MYFPVFIDLTEKNILVVGAGGVASRRICVLHEFAGRITVTAPAICEKIERLADTAPDTLKLLRRGFAESDLEGMDIVIAATDDAALNRRIAALCAKRGIFVNVASEQSLCDFQFPSIVREGDVVIGINASGKDHRLVKKTRERVEQCLQTDRRSSFYK